MTKIVIDTHSFIDVITNSSTEIFVCKTDKSVEMIQDLFREICEKHGDMDWYHNELRISELDDGKIQIMSWLNDPDWFIGYVKATFTVIRYE